MGRTSLVSWRPIPIGLPTIDVAWAIEARFGVPWWDALMVAATLAGGSDYLLSEDRQDFDGVCVVSPFTAEPAAKLGARAAPYFV